MHLDNVLKKYQIRSLSNYSSQLDSLRSVLEKWAGDRLLRIDYSGSMMKGTAISLSSDMDLFVSLCSEEDLRAIYEDLYRILNEKYPGVRKQNVSVRINVLGNSFSPASLAVDITPARKISTEGDDHSLYVSRYNTWTKTNVKKHINDVKFSGFQDEIKLLKIWREKNRLSFPSIYLEYLIINNILLYRSKGGIELERNFRHAILELGKTSNNPLWDKVVDPANGNNIFSALLNEEEKHKIIHKARSELGKSIEEIIS